MTDIFAVKSRTLLALVLMMVSLSKADVPADVQTIAPILLEDRSTDESLLSDERNDET